MRLRPVTILLATLAVAVSGCSPMKAPPPKPGGLAVGDPAYEFKLMDPGKNWVKLSDVQEGWYTALFLIRGSWCSSCIDHLSEIKTEYAKFQELKAAVVCISNETPVDLAEFQRQWRFPFPLLSDVQFKVIDAYGARHAKGHEGKDIAFTTVVIIDPARKVIYKKITPRPFETPSIAELLDLLRKFKQNPTPAP